MRDLRTVAIGLALLGLFMAPAAKAQVSRTWISGVGDDANPCSRTAPCKTFAGAISKTKPGGEIGVLDPAAAGTVTITKSITLNGRGELAAISASGIPGITINAGTSGVVRLKGLTLNGAGATLGNKGIRILAAKKVYIEDCKILNFSAQGIDVAVPAATAVPEIYLRNVTISRVDTGILATGGKVVIENSQIIDSATGIKAEESAQVSVTDSVISGHSSNGVLALTSASVNLERTAVADNATGLRGEGVIRISDVLLSHNAASTAGNIESFGNNRLNAGNAPDTGTATTTTLLPLK